MMTHIRVPGPSFWWLGVVLAAALCGGCLGPVRERDQDAWHLPDEAAALSLVAAGPAETLRGRALVAYLSDRGADHLAFNQVAVTRRLYRDRTDPTNRVRVEVHELGSPLDATGLLRLVHRGEPEVDVGREGRQHTDNAIAFVQGRYYVSAGMRLTGRGALKRLTDLGSLIAADLPADETGLEFLDALPADAVRGTVYFVRHERPLAALVPLPAGSALGFVHADTLGLVAERADGLGMLVLQRYAEAEQARIAGEHARRTIGLTWSQWALAPAGRYLLTFARHTGRATGDDVDRTEALVRRIAQERP